MREMGDTEQSTVESGDSGDISRATDDQTADGERLGESERSGQAPSAEPGESGPAEPSAGASAERGGQRAETSGESGLTTSGTAAEPGESGPAEPGTDTIDEPRGEATAGPSAEADPSAPDAADTAETGPGPEGADDRALAEPGENGPAGESEPAGTPEPGPAGESEPAGAPESGPAADERGDPGESAEPGEPGEPEEPDEPEERRAEEPAHEAVDESPEQAADEPEAGEPEAAGEPAEPADEAAPDDIEQPGADPVRGDEPGSERTDGGRDEAAAGGAPAPGHADHDADNSGPKTFASNNEAAEYGRAMWGDAAGNLNAQERDALWGYSGDKSPGEAGPPDYQEINGFLRGKSAGSPEVANSVQQIDHALQSGATQENVMVLRETGFGAFDRPVGELRGSIQRDPAYLSTALGSDPTFDPEKPVVLHLEAPAGTPAMYMEGLSQFPAERELLLGRGLQYQVDDVQRTGGRWHIYGKILAP